MKEIDTFEVSFEEASKQLKLDLIFHRSCFSCGTRIETKSEVGFIQCEDCKGHKNARQKNKRAD